MWKELTAFSRHEYLLLYDPGAIPEDTPVDPDLEAQEPVPLPAPARSELARRGLALMLEVPSDDCEATIRVLVDQAPEASLQERAAQALDGAILRVTGGQLTFDGIEFLCRAGETRWHSQGESMEVPPSEYLVEVLNLIPWKHQHRADEINKNTRKLDRLFDRVVEACMWPFLLLFWANIFAPGVILVALFAAGWRQALTIAAVILAVDVLLLAGGWAFDGAAHLFPALKRAQNARIAFEAENPDVLVCLRKTAHAPDRHVPATATIDLA